MIIGDRAEWYFGSGLGLAFERGSDCIVLPMSVKDRLLHWVQGRSQTYYPKHILVYGRREGLLLSYHGFWLFLDWPIGGGNGGGLSTALSLGLWSGGLESKFGRGPRPHDRRVVSWSYLCLGYKRGMCFGVPSWAHWFTNHRAIRYGLSTVLLMFL